MNVSGLSLMWNLIKKLPPDLFDPNQKRQTSKGRENCRYCSIGGSYSIVVGIERMFGAQFQ
jgi:hypothetical protein